MTTMAKKKTRTRRASQPDRTVVYHGIKIASMTGRRSPLAQAIREGFRSNAERSRGEPAQA
jgi:hypothetical protein